MRDAALGLIIVATKRSVRDFGFGGNDSDPSIFYFPTHAARQHAFVKFAWQEAKREQFVRRLVWLLN